jgi:hypothetical protein
MGLRSPISSAGPRRRSAAQPRASGGLQRAEVDGAHRLRLALYATRLASMGSRLPADEEVALCWRLREDGPRFAYSCGFREAGRPSRQRPYSTLAPYAPPPRAVLGAAMTDTSTRRALRYTLRWTLWDTCSPCSSLRPQSKSGLGWARWRRPCKRLQASR